jgi:predicted transcriptional regulator
MSHLPNYLRARRKRWALAQYEMALLLGITTQAAVSQYESDDRLPQPDILIAYEIIPTFPG